MTTPLDKQITCYHGVYWPTLDTGNKIITETHADQNTTAYNLMFITGDIPGIISELVKDKNVIIQAGGNAGYYPKLYAQYFKHVYTFEPDPLNFYCLNLNCNVPNVYKFQACLGDSNDCVNVNNATESLGHGGSHVNGEGHIPTIKIDQLNLHECNVIHLDVEGYEEHALRGAKETIKRCKPVIVIEDYAPWLARYNSNLQIVEGFLKELNYGFHHKIKNNDRVYTHLDSKYII